MKIVVTGKGGAGKTTVSGALARQLARAGHRVIALDCDPSPGLGITLGFGPEATEAAPAVLNELVAMGHTHNDPDPDPENLLTRFGVDGPDSVRLLVGARVEKLEGTCVCCGSHSTTRKLFSNLPHDGRIVLADLEAGLNDLIWAAPQPGDVVVAIAEPSAKSFEIARRACELAETMGVGQRFVVANRATEEDVARLTGLTGLAAFAVPDDPAVAEADRDGVAPMDNDPSSPAMLAIARLFAELDLASQPNVAALERRA
jgi:CO dehydrogenase maturation factor